MDTLLQPTIFAALTFATAAVLAHVAARRLLDASVGDRRRLKQRLRGQLQPKQSLNQQSQRLMREQGGRVLAELLGKYEFVASLRKSLKQAMPNVTFERFLAIVAASALGMFVLGLIVSGGSVVAGGVAMLLGLYGPFLVLTRKRMKRQKMLADQLPDALDFLGRSLRAGHSLPIGLQLMGGELPAPLCEEFGRCYDEISLGAGPDAALKNMIDRIDSTDFAFFVTAVLVQRQTGGDLAQVLDNITGMLRQRVQLQQQVKAKTAEGRFTGLILGAFPTIMFLILMVMNRPYAELLVTESLGLAFLGGSLFLSGLGLVVIKRITNVTV